MSLKKGAYKEQLNQHFMKQLLYLVFILLTLQSIAQRGERRIALVIGNGDYKNDKSITNAANDAQLMATTLEKLGFLVIKHINADKKQIESAIHGYSKYLKHNNVALFYYSGHGVNYKGKNYIVPVSAPINSVSDIPKYCVPAQAILSKFKKQPEAINIFIADVFRDLPYINQSTWGFNAIKPPSGSLIAFAAADGTPSGESGANYGIYTEKLVEQIQIHQSMREVFKKTKQKIEAGGNSIQKPKEWIDLNGKFYFKTANYQWSQINNNTDIYLIPKADQPVTLRINSTMKGIFYLGKRPLGKFDKNSLYTLPNIAPGKYTLRMNKWSVDVIMEAGKTYNITTGTIKESGTIKAQVVDKTGVEMVTIEGGSFAMGSNQGDNDEKPIHQVTVKSFSLSRTEVTIEQYCKFLNDIKCPANGKSGRVELIDLESEDAMLHYQNGKFVPNERREHYPITGVNWFAANAYCKWAGGRLPTEAEWEYAARGGKEQNPYLFSGSNKVNEVAWYVQNSKMKGSDRDYDIRPVAQKNPNSLGIYDMSGNVWEWCSDWYAPYQTQAQTNPNGSEKGRYKTLRGGSSRFEIARCRVAYRYSRTPLYSNNDRGIRLARDTAQ